MSYDTKCYELAKCFAEEEQPPLNETELGNLAQIIQDAIEDYLHYGRKENDANITDR